MVAAPVVWISGKVSGVENVNAVQDNRIMNLEQAYTQQREDNREMVKKIDALLINRGINPDKVLENKSIAP